MRGLLGAIGMRLAVLVVEFTAIGRMREAQWVEARLLNPIQRRLGATVSDYALNASAPHPKARR